MLVVVLSSIADDEPPEPSDWMVIVIVLGSTLIGWLMLGCACGCGCADCVVCIGASIASRPATSVWGVPPIDEPTPIAGIIINVAIGATVELSMLIMCMLAPGCAWLGCWP